MIEFRDNLDKYIEKLHEVGQGFSYHREVRYLPIQGMMQSGLYQKTM